MNGEKFHLFDATVDLFDPSKINSDSRNSDVKPLFLRVILVVRVYLKNVVGIGDADRRCSNGAVSPFPRGRTPSASTQRGGYRCNAYDADVF
jgi:hypothetical protein